MQIVLLRHPVFFGSRSMRSYSEIIEEGMRKRGHDVIIWEPVSRFHRVPFPRVAKKWLGYVDQFVWFPCEVRRRLLRVPMKTLFVVPDQALGMWVPLIARRLHVIHCHDFLALRSAWGEFPENPTSWTGRLYQERIRRGFNAGCAFVSISEATRRDLHRFLDREPMVSEVVYNGLHYPFLPLRAEEVEALLPDAQRHSPFGCVLHVGAQVWYKNRLGVIEIYRAYVRRSSSPLPLWIVGDPPDESVRAAAAAVPAPGRVVFFSNLSNEMLNAAYCHAKVLLFPSLGEGFGWPVAEAMACGTPVITTEEAPMTEIGGASALYLRRRLPFGDCHWAECGADLLVRCLTEEASSRRARIYSGLDRIMRFTTLAALDGYEAIYRRVIRNGRE